MIPYALKAWLLQRRDLKSSIRRTFRNQKVPRVSLDDLNWRASLSDIDTFGIGRRRQRADWLFALDIDRLRLPAVSSLLPDTSSSSSRHLTFANTAVEKAGEQKPVNPSQTSVPTLATLPAAAVPSPHITISGIKLAAKAPTHCSPSQWTATSQTGRSAASLALLPALERRVQYRQLPSPAFHREMQAHQRFAIHKKRALAAERSRRSVALVGELRGTSLDGGSSHTSQSKYESNHQDTSSTLRANDLLHWVSFDEETKGLMHSIQEVYNYSSRPIFCIY